MSPPSTPNDDAARPLDEHLSAVEDAIRTHCTAYLDRVAERLHALRSAVGEARDRHTALREELALDPALSESTPPDDADRRPRASVTQSRLSAADWSGLWQRICTYRRRVREEVLTPIRAHLDDEPLGPALTGQRTQLVENLRAVAEEQPSPLARPEPDALYAPAADDGWTQRLQKWSVRSRRRVRSVLGLSDDSDPVQTVPLRPLVRHRIGELVARHRSAIAAVEEHLMGWLADLERVCTSATHTLLEVEQRIDHLDYHHTQDAIEQPAPQQAPSLDLEASLDVPQAPPTSEVPASVQAQVDALHAVLEAGASLSIADLRPRVWRPVDATVAGLRDAVTTPWPATAAPTDAPAAQAPDWTDWDEQARSRLGLCITMLAFYADVETIRDDLIHALLEEGPSPVCNTFETMADQLSGCEDDLETLLGDAGKSTDAEPALEAESDAASTPIDAPIREAITIVDEHLDALRPLSFTDRLQSVVQSHLDALQARVEDLPETVSVHVLSEVDAPPIPSAEAYDVPLRPGAAATFDVLFFDRLRSAAQHVVDVLSTEVDRATQVLDVLRFGRDAANDEESDQNDEEPPNSGPVLDHQGVQDSAIVQGGAPASGFPSLLSTAPAFDDSLDDADALARGSLQRSLRLLRARRRDVEAVSYQWADTVWHAFRHGMTRLHDQWGTESRFQSRMTRLTRRLAREARDAAAEAQERVQHGRLRLRNWLTRGRQWLDAGIHAVQASLGLTDAGSEEVRESIDTLAALGSSLERLPIVYRRLFSFEPVDDPDLFKGREEERAFVERYVERWQRGLPTSLLLVGDRGSGLTSLLKVVRATTLQDAALHHLRLDDRPDSEAQLAAQVARSLGLALPAHERPSLDDVAQALRDASSSPPSPASSTATRPASAAATPVRACFVEHLEQLLLRTVGGLDLLDRMLTFISRTDAHVLWIGTMSTAAWQLVEKRLPAAAELVTHEHVDPLGRDAIENVIMSRHRRSGLALHFEAPDGTSPLQARPNQDERREAFFDRLYEESHQNVALALLYWFRSVEPGEDGTGLRVQPLQPISFRVLDELTRKQDFALKAFLVHSSLTVEEYSQIAHISPADSVDVMESLGNASLIEPVDGPAGRTADVYFDAVVRTVRYRIRPLLVAPIVQHLQAHNIVH